MASESDRYLLFAWLLGFLIATTSCSSCCVPTARQARDVVSLRRCPTPPSQSRPSLDWSSGVSAGGESRGASEAASATEWSNGFGMRFVLAPVSRLSESKRDDSVVHDGRASATRQLSSQFWIQDREVTIDQWNAFAMATGVAKKAGLGELPVASVSYPDVAEFIAWLSTVEAVPYRLPTLEEWMQVCELRRRREWTIVELEHDERGVQLGGPHVVGTRGAPGEDIFDLEGNVAEWTSTVDEEFNRRVQAELAAEGLGPLTIETTSRYIAGRGWRDGSRVEPCFRGLLPGVIRRDDTGFRLAVDSSAPSMRPRVRADAR